MQSLIRFGVSGIVATVAHVAVFILLVEWIHVRPVFASVPAFLTAVGFSYGLNYRWTFAADGPHTIMLPRFFLVAMVGLGMNMLITWIVVDVGHYWYGYALAVIMVFIPLMTFFLSKLWVFSSKSRKMSR